MTIVRSVGRAVRTLVTYLLHPWRRRRASRRLSSLGEVSSILFVCTGNICRSPYAAAETHDRIKRGDRTDVVVESAGFIGPGREAPEHARVAASARGVDLTGHRSRLVTTEDVEGADVLVCMEPAHREKLVEAFYALPDRIVCLGDLDPERPDRRGLLDPWDQDTYIFDSVYRRIDRCLDVLLRELRLPSERPREDATTRLHSAGTGDEGGPVRRGGVSSAEVPAGVERPCDRKRQTPHHFTLDLEEYFHPCALKPWISRSEWDILERRSSDVVPELLDALDRFGVRATFFVLGWLAEREPDLVRRIASAGHEIASHGWDHERIPNQTPEEFRASVRRTKRFLEDLTGRPVRGFRAPSFSIIPGVEWALDVLVEEGYAYDSSIFPVRIHPTYGYPTDRRDPHWIRRASGPIVELPMSTLKLGPASLPASGGAYFRFLPYALVRTGLRAAGRRGAPGMFYLHPWELDVEMPEFSAPWITRLRMRGRSATARRRLRRLMQELEFQTIWDTVETMRFQLGRRGSEAGSR